MFYEKILLLCKSRGISPSKLMVNLKMSKSNIGRWESGSIPQNRVIKRITEYFCVPADYFDETEDKKEIIQSQQPMFTQEDIEMLLKIKNLSSTKRKEVESFVDYQESLDKSKDETSATAVK